MKTFCGDEMKRTHRKLPLTFLSVKLCESCGETCSQPMCPTGATCASRVKHACKHGTHLCRRALARSAGFAGWRCASSLWTWQRRKQMFIIFIFIMETVFAQTNSGLHGIRAPLMLIRIWAQRPREQTQHTCTRLRMPSPGHIHTKHSCRGKTKGARTNMGGRDDGCYTPIRGI